MKFSIITACYNASPFLTDCIKSVLDQSCKDFEWIFVDDDSKDNSSSIVESVCDHRFTVIRNTNRLFCSGAYALALSKAKGDIVGVLDADDALHPDALRVVLEKYEQHPQVGYIYTQHYWCDEKLQVKRPGLSSRPYGSLVEAGLRQKKHCFSHFRTFRRLLASKTVIFPLGLKAAVDKQMGFALEEVSVGGFLPQKLYYYRYHKKNMSKTQSTDQRVMWIKLARERERYRRMNGIRVYPIRELR